MATRPSTLPEWATSGTRTTPTSGQRVTGFVFKETVPFDLLNAQLGELGDWVEYLDEDGALRETSIVDLDDTDGTVTDIDAGRPFYVSQSVLGPLQRISGVNIGATVVDVCSDGEYIWAVTATALFRLSAEDLTGGGSAFWTAPAGTVACVACAGGIVYVASSASVYAVSRTAGTTLKTQAIGSTVTRLKTNGAALFLSRGNYIERWDIVADPTYIAGAANWQYDHGATILDLCIFASSAVGVGVSDYAVGVAAACVPSGGGATDVGGVVLDDDGADYNIAGVFSNGVTCYSVGSNGRVIAWGRRDGSTDGYISVTGTRGIRSVTEVLIAQYSTQVLTDQTADDDIRRIVVTDRHIIAIDDTSGGSSIYVCDVANGALIGAAVDSGRTARVSLIAADVRGIVVGLTTGATNEVERFSDGVGTRLCVRRGATDPGRSPYFQLLCPIAW